MLRRNNPITELIKALGGSLTTFVTLHFYYKLQNDLLNKEVVNKLKKVIETNEENIRLLEEANNN